MKFRIKKESDLNGLSPIERELVTIISDRAGIIHPASRIICLAIGVICSTLGLIGAVFGVMTENLVLAGTGASSFMFGVILCGISHIMLMLGVTAWCSAVSAYYVSRSSK